MAISSERNDERDKMITMTAISYQCNDIVGPMNNLIPGNRQQNEIIGRSKNGCRYRQGKQTRRWEKRPIHI